MQFDPNKAIYLQIADHIMNRIMDGTFSTDQRVPSVRELAAEMEVNPNTTVRSYEWLEQRGIIFNRRGCGYFVAANGTKSSAECDAPNSTPMNFHGFSNAYAHSAGLQWNSHQNMKIS